MKKISAIAAAASLLLTSCSMTDLNDTRIDEGGKEVRFSVYQEQSIQTRGTDASTKVGDTMRIGMFAFYHNSGKSFGSSGNVSPDFMYNQKVESIKGGEWKYSPVKYWPNSPGARLSFFAYAPYSASKTWESMGISVSETGKYMDVTFPVYNDVDDQKDWLWAEPKLNVGAVAAGGEYSLKDTLDFTFKHAMSKLWFAWGVDLENNRDKVDDERYHNNITEWPDVNTEICMNYIKVEGLYKTMTMRYNLEDGTGPEIIGGGIQNMVLTKKDFTKDSLINTDNGVFANYKYLSNNLYLSPQDLVENPVKVTVSVTIRTTDPANPANNSVVENVITKNLADFWQFHSNLVYPIFDNTFMQMEANKKYVVYFLVGMNDVQFKASEVKWGDGLCWQTFLPANL